MDFIPALISGVFVLVGIVVQIILNRRKDTAGANRDDAEADKLSAETRKTDTETILSLKNALTEQEKQIAELRETVNDLFDGIVIMRQQLLDAKIQPAWTPKKRMSTTQA